MTKFNALAFVAALMFAGSSVFAGDKACCAHQASNAKKDCSATFANLDLTAEQKTKMETLAAECHKGGCTKESMAKMEKGAKGILSKDQLAAWMAACSGKTAEKTQS